MARKFVHIELSSKYNVIMDLKAMINEFKSQVAFTLALVWLLAVWKFQTANSFLYPLFAVVLMTVLDLGWTYLNSRKLYFPSASWVTGFLIGLIIVPTEPIWIITAAVFLAFASKQFIRVGLRQHIFNPAAFGLMATSLIFGTSVVWWGVAWGKLPLLILVPLMIRILWRMKRLWLPFTFLTVYYWFYQSVRFDTQESIRILTDPSVLLFAFVMLPEPITSPATGLFKYGFGAGVAMLAIVLSYTKILGEVFLPALLAGNLIGFLILRFKKSST